MAQSRSIFQRRLKKWAQLKDDPGIELDYLPGRLVKLVSDSDVPILGTGIIINTRYVRGGHTSFSGYSIYLDVLWSNGEYYMGVAKADLVLVPSCQEGGESIS